MTLMVGLKKAWRLFILQTQKRFEKLPCMVKKEISSIKATLCVAREWHSWITSTHEISKILGECDEIVFF
jgi:hypothetical protein